MQPSKLRKRFRRWRDRTAISAVPTGLGWWMLLWFVFPNKGSAAESGWTDDSVVKLPSWASSPGRKSVFNKRGCIEPAELESRQRSQSGVTEEIICHVGDDLDVVIRSYAEDIYLEDIDDETLPNWLVAWLVENDFGVVERWSSPDAHEVP